MKIKIFEVENDPHKSFLIFVDDSLDDYHYTTSIKQSVNVVKQMTQKALEENITVAIVFPTSRIVHRPHDPKSHAPNPDFYYEVSQKHQSMFWKTYSS